MQLLIRNCCPANHGAQLTLWKLISASSAVPVPPPYGLRASEVLKKMCRCCHQDLLWQGATGALSSRWLLQLAWVQKNLPKSARQDHWRGTASPTNRPASQSATSPLPTHSSCPLSPDRDSTILPLPRVNTKVLEAPFAAQKTSHTLGWNLSPPSLPTRHHWASITGHHRTASHNNLWMGGTYLGVQNAFKWRSNPLKSSAGHQGDFFTQGSLMASISKALDFISHLKYRSSSKVAVWQWLKNWYTTTTITTKY